ncbi:Uncharacterized membrane-anchored protein [Paenibacillus sp. UNC496MF]|uniref:COG4705 family protein n=1 Tax=Paenibacillus sp. UNC496MF TaxID=1502753 RepID=UPI0008EADE18|nr:hypothetical protein [Paenibacillus sp. UNC496MF]SFJ35393.1 Uncharacterized membrane-anchored protein [Paenibacillus sp. UNC496MF]
MSEFLKAARQHTGGLLAKVPEITVYFWITKLLTTGMGEVASDFLFERLNPVLSAPLSVLLFVAAMLLQFKARRYVPGVYWLVVVMVSIFGTTAADVVRVGLGIPYIASTLFFMIALAALLVVWHKREGTLSVHSVFTRRREIFYWLTVLTTFALGTAAGDMTAESMQLGYLASGLLFAAVLAVPAIAFYRFGLRETAAFWFAYIMTRPVGASFADWMSAAHARGGLGWGKGPVTFVLTVLIVLLVVFRGGAPAREKEDETVPTLKNERREIHEA